MTVRWRSARRSIRLRPAPHCRTPVPSYSLKVTPGQSLRQLAAGPARQLAGAASCFPEPATELKIEVDLVAELAVVQSVRLLRRGLRRDLPVRLSRRARATNCAPYLRGRSRPAPLLAATFSTPIPRAAEQHRRFPRRRSTQRLQQDDRLRHPHGARRADAGARRWRCARAPAATPAGCWCRSCAVSASPRASSPAT